MPTEYRNQGDWSPCISNVNYHMTFFVTILNVLNLVPDGDQPQVGRPLDVGQVVAVIVQVLLTLGVLVLLNHESNLRF